jgi:hypothetical protein
MYGHLRANGTLTFATEHSGSAARRAVADDHVALASTFRLVSQSEKRECGAQSRNAHVFATKASQSL